MKIVNTRYRDLKRKNRLYDLLSKENISEEIELYEYLIFLKDGYYERDDNYGYLTVYNFVSVDGVKLFRLYIKDNIKISEIYFESFFLQNVSFFFEDVKADINYIFFNFLKEYIKEEHNLFVGKPFNDFKHML